MTTGLLRRARNTLVAVAVAATVLATAPGAAMAGTSADPDLCRNGGGSGYLSCNGKDPNAMGCTSATTKKEGMAKNGIYVELRYSSVCQSYWTRYTNYPGGASTAWIRGNSVNYKKELAGYEGETGWTPMAAANQNPRACLQFYYGGEWLEYCPN